MYNALGQRVEDYQGPDTLTLTYPRDIFGQRTGTFAQWPSQNWTGWNVYWSQVAGQRLNMGGVDAYIDHSDAVGSTTMETDPAGAVQWDVTHYPWGRVFQEQGIRQSEVVMGLDWQVNDPAVPSATREFNFRDYRWMTPDPDNAGSNLGDSQSWNMYSYAGNNPISRTDPSGQDYKVCQEGDSGDKSNCKVLTDAQYSDFVEQNKDTLSFAGNKIFANGTQIGTSEYIPTIYPNVAFALHGVGDFANAEIKSAAVSMAINGALAGVGALIGAGAESLLAAEGS
jgi:RHS repeat-associated protein